MDVGLRMLVHYCEVGEISKKEVTLVGMYTMALYSTTTQVSAAEVPSWINILMYRDVTLL